LQQQTALREHCVRVAVSRIKVEEFEGQGCRVRGYKARVGRIHYQTRVRVAGSRIKVVEFEVLGSGISGSGS
jgi:hypothetical protein